MQASILQIFLVMFLGLDVSAQLTANMIVWQEDNVCEDGPSASCSDLGPNTCCEFGSFGGTCMIFAPTFSDTSGAVGGAWKTDGDNQCGDLLDAADAFVCICPNGEPEITGTSWEQDGVLRRRTGQLSACTTTVKPDIYSYKQNGTRWVLRKQDQPEVVAQIEAGLESGAVSREDITQTIIQLGAVGLDP